MKNRVQREELHPVLSAYEDLQRRIAIYQRIEASFFARTPDLDDGVRSISV